MNKRERVAGESRIKVRNADETPKRWRTYLLMGVCLALLVSGFFFAGRQHFSSMDYGMKNSKLRNEIIKLEAEKLRLVHSREVALSPGEIRKAAKKAGIIGAMGGTPIAELASAKEKTVPAGPNAGSDPKPLIIKTAVVAPAKPDVQTAVLKSEKPTRSVKKTTIAAE